MKLLLYTDVHWAETSSIIRGRGEKYSLRLENLINSVNWAERLAISNKCDAVVNLGDFFDRPNLTSEEITALKEIEWSNVPHYFLVGNHDANINDLSFASTFVFNQFNIISEPTFIMHPGAEILLLPYTIDDNRDTIDSYFFGEKHYFNDIRQKRIVLSHNDIAGIQYGKFTSTSGFPIDEILKDCDLFINGHLHNAGFVDEKERVLNLGNLSGLNFNEDANIYKHYAAILDTNTLGIKFFQNPYAFNFYKLRVENIDDLQNINLELNAVVSIQCPLDMVDAVREFLNNHSVVTYRVQSFQTSDNIETVDISQLAQTDHLQRFSQYVLEHLDNTDVLKDELVKVVGQC